MKQLFWVNFGEMRVYLSILCQMLSQIFKPLFDLVQPQQPWDRKETLMSYYLDKQTNM